MTSSKVDDAERVRKPRPFPAALAHGELNEVFPGVFFVTGTVGMPGPLPVRFSRNMVVVREDERLVLINSVRLSEAGLAALQALGSVSDVIRIAGFHGADDAFYKQRCGARVCKPSASELRGVLGLDFEHVLPAHGAPVIGGAKAAYRPALERAAAKRAAAETR